MMATIVYDAKEIRLLDDRPIYLTPLKIKYLREFMVIFDLMKNVKNDEGSIMLMSECVRICMQQYSPEIASADQIEDLMDLPMMYDVLEIAAGIKLNKEKKEVEDEEKSNLWETLDLAKLEAEVFLLGIWKSYEELESSISLPELMLTIGQKRELDYNEKKFLAGIQGIDLDEQSGKKENKWEEMKARVFSGGKAKDENDILAYQGVNAQKAGFGIGMGLGYEDLTKK